MSKDESIEAQDATTMKVIDAFHHKMHSLRMLAASQLKHAKENGARDQAVLAQKMSEATQLLAASKNHYDVAQATETLGTCWKALQLYQGYPHEIILAEIIFTSLFSSFDAYLNHLLRNLYSRDPLLLHHFEHKHVSVAELLSQSKHEIIDSLVDKDLDSLLRKSYTEIFDKLAARFGVSSLTRVKNWPVFIECSQRRNVIVHCDGIVSGQYLKNCAEAGVKLDPGLKAGSKLTVTDEYLFQAIDVVAEVGLKLGQALWRISSVASIDRADAHLGNFIFELLKLELWTLALWLGEFSQLLSKLKYERLRNERSLKIIIINHAQAARWSGDHTGAAKIIGNVDWSASAPEFRLSVACLEERWDDAATLMKIIGATSNDLPIHGYVGWPIFREFRTKPQFLTAFRSIFGVEFASEVKKASTKAPEK